MRPFNWKRGKQVLTVIWVLLPLLATMLWLFLLLGALHLPNLLTPSVSPDSAARDILKICRLWYVVLGTALLGGFPIIFLAGRFASRKLPGAGVGRITLICLIFPCLLLFVLASTEELPAKFSQAGKDLTQIEDHFLVQAEVWISPKAHPAPLPGPYSGSLEEVSTRYGIIGDDTGGEWVRVYIPDAMGFSLDETRLYNEDLPIIWNLEHAQRYQIRYTSNFHLVVEIAPVS